LREIKITGYTFGLIVTIVGLALYSYYVRELLAALSLFSAAFFFLALAGLGALLVWSASVQVAIWTRPASRNVIAFSRRLIAAYAKP
jgi:multisubunit Na+/H+ antiporter MnhG subunit